MSQQQRSAHFVPPQGVIGKLIEVPPQGVIGKLIEALCRKICVRVAHCRYSKHQRAIEAFFNEGVRIRISNDEMRINKIAVVKGDVTARDVMAEMLEDLDTHEDRLAPRSESSTIPNGVKTAKLWALRTGSEILNRAVSEFADGRHAMAYESRLCRDDHAGTVFFRTPRIAMALRSRQS